jgi:hypothetical protein
MDVGVNLFRFFIGCVNFGRSVLNNYLFFIKINSKKIRYNYVRSRGSSLCVSSWQDKALSYSFNRQIDN